MRVCVYGWERLVERPAMHKHTAPVIELHETRHNPHTRTFLVDEPPVCPPPARHVHAKHDSVGLVGRLLWRQPGQAARFDGQRHEAQAVRKHLVLWRAVLVLVLVNVGWRWCHERSSVTEVSVGGTLFGRPNNLQPL
jgi:hypothetical protein